MKRFIVLLSLSCLAVASQADIINLEPTGIPSQLFTTNTNDGFGAGRGVTFTANTNLSVTGIGLFNDLTNVNATYTIRQITTLSGNVNIGSTLLGSVTGIVGGSGAQYYDLTLGSAVNLVAGQNYHVEATYSEDANGNYFYDWNNISFNLGDVTILDGTQGADTSNTVAPVMRLTTAPVPEPATMGAMALGLAALARRRRKQ